MKSENIPSFSIDIQLMLLPFFLNMSSSDPLILNQADW